MKLLPVSDIRDELGFDTGTDVNNAIDAAIDSAMASVGALLGTDFTPGTVTDLFFVREPGAVFVGSVLTEFRLSQGFVNNIVSVGRHDMPTSNKSAVEHLILKKEKGVLVDHTTYYRNQYLTVTYTKGIDLIEVEGAPAFDPTRIPAWLKNAIRLQARIYLGSSPTFKSAGVDQDLDVLRAQFRDTLLPHLRYTPNAVTPL